MGNFDTGDAHSNPFTRENIYAIDPSFQPACPRQVQHGMRPPGKDTSLVAPNALERPSASRPYEPLMKKLARYVLIILDELGGPSKRMDEALTCIRQPRNRLGDADTSTDRTPRARWTTAGRRLATTWPSATSSRSSSAARTSCSATRRAAPRHPPACTQSWSRPRRTA